MLYVSRIVKATVPHSLGEAAILAVMVPVLVMAGQHLLFRDPPEVTVHSETATPPQANAGSVFFTSVQVSYSENCRVRSSRWLRASNGVSYKLGEDLQEVLKDVPVRYLAQSIIPGDVPPGPAYVRSDMEYGCDLWTRYVSPRTVRGRAVRIEIREDLSMSLAPVWEFAQTKPRKRKSLPAGA